MASENKKRKSDKKLHWGRGKNFMKWVGKGIKGLVYFTSSQRRENNKFSTDIDDDPKTIMVLSLDCDDFSEWKKQSGLIPEGVSFVNRFKVGNTTYRCITDVCDLCSLRADEIIETEHAIENPDYYHIIEISKTCINVRP